MACKCVDDTGNALDKCLGLCGEWSKTLNVTEQGRDPMQGLMEIMLAQVDKMIKSQLSYLRIEFQKEQVEIYKKGFEEGIVFGISLEQANL